jgi:hypothetical protein
MIKKQLAGRKIGIQEEPENIFALYPRRTERRRVLQQFHI